MIRIAMESDVPAMLAIYAPFVQNTTVSFTGLDYGYYLIDKPAVDGVDVAVTITSNLSGSCAAAIQAAAEVATAPRLRRCCCRRIA